MHSVDKMLVWSRPGRTKSNRKAKKSRGGKGVEASGDGDFHSTGEHGRNQDRYRPGPASGDSCPHPVSSTSGARRS